ncbi:fumarylacetoacetate hydrolase family protein [Labedaea rhizosphaerae]|uniref:5-oxopent-3-ene-1,2,5-tricarboxylate decarboxylase/2-hydroxyhepta-2,4-diene-1,7-dioate isomerase n=1 Tax=Labedaea rhizosphaerae TaxID=598644 RepID=A0A4R6S6A7_LABRH|nr:fumarylacetoacetate hydrolase family protein [Labedaea rhizosphaerae]TDP94844.1 5-oxopent-3-ene-1,2,5-tricarboxylate decarboxylase/2-hydroxyhepta-2,4-diene-1,7-dioate isomerase [Labedaea rhizosphaerae]
MRLARIRRGPGERIELAALVEGEELVSLASVDGCADADPVAALAELGVERLAEHTARLAGGERLAAAELVFEPPVATCTKICCLALNYADHAAESGLEVPPEPVLFFKPTTALIGHGAVVRPPARTRHVEHEVELAVVIGHVAHGLTEENWQDAVAGYTVVNDMTARDLQLANIARNQPWDQFKGFDTFAPLGPYLVTRDEVPDPQNLELTLTVGGEVRQRANTKQMVFPLPRLLADLSDGMTLLPGDVIATGTMAGIAPVADGDVMHATVAGVGTLTNPVRWQST